MANLKSESPEGTQGRDTTWGTEIYYSPIIRDENKRLEYEKCHTPCVQERAYAALNEQSLLKVVVEGYGYGVERHSQNFFIYIVVVSFCFWLRTFEDI